MSQRQGFSDRLKDGDNILVAEGYLFEFEAKGYLKMGPFVPQVVLERPDLVREMHREFVHAGSDVVLAFTVSIIILFFKKLENTIQCC